MHKREISVSKHIITSRNILKHYNIRIIPNINPAGRNIVIKNNDYCWRLNPLYVDLNRNWDSNHGSFKPSSTTWFGKYPYSELETNFALFQIEKTKPEIFFAIHSGIYASVYPNGTTPKFNYSKTHEGIHKIFESFKKKYCDMCELGNSLEVVKYVVGGTSKDFNYNNGSILSSTLEIFTGLKYKDRRRRLGPIMRKKSSIEKPDETIEDKEEDQERCFIQFNPTTKEIYNSELERWKYGIRFILKKYFALK